MKFRFKLTQLLTLSLFFCLLMIVSCQKESSRNGTDDQQEMEASQVSSESDTEAEMVFNGIFDDAMGVNGDVGIGGTGIFGRVTACPDVTITHLNPPDLFPAKVVLDFGANGCVGNDGHMRRGKIIIHYTGRLLFPGSVATTIFEGFYFDSIKVEGTHKITNTSPSSNTPPARQFTVDVINGKLIRPSGNFIEWNSHKVITQIEGLLTPAPLDDIFKVEGNASGKVKRGALIVLWQSTITEPLVKRFNCRWIVKGRVRTTRVNTNTSSPWVAVLDFGAGTCDNQATLTINGVTHQITLP
ncbi:MAG TPA: hypothetical protein VGO58_16780 [Chitinophagaceae bacterium]|jgi:hypothetical protein|nr:hypothetical protein [Chitinophagaceae bacterium]